MKYTHTHTQCVQKVAVHLLEVRSDVHERLNRPETV